MATAEVSFFIYEYEMLVEMLMSRYMVHKHAYVPDYNTYRYVHEIIWLFLPYIDTAALVFFIPTTTSTQSMKQKSCLISSSLSF